jgi:phospholipase/lecithinase/hemolysin
MSWYFGTLTTVFLTAVVVIASLMVAPAEAAPLRIDNLVVFGDSLSDIGNDYELTQGAVPPASLYFQGRFTNGPLWVDYLADVQGVNLRPSRVVADPSAGSVNFAHAGASTGAGNLTPGGFFVPGVVAQVESYRTALANSGRQAEAQTLFVIWGGANDYLLGLTEDPVEPTGNLRAAIEQLYDAGARRFLVPNLPDLSVAPIVNRDPALRALSEQHNRLLERALTELDQTLPDATLTRLDVEALFNTWLADPAAYGFTSGSAPGSAAGCLLPPFRCLPVNAAGTPFFWDEQHPSTEVHVRIAQAALRALEDTDPVEVSEPGSIVLITGGLVGFGLLVRRSRRFNLNPAVRASMPKCGR